jgi:hypothetical protein
MVEVHALSTHRRELAKPARVTPSMCEPQPNSGGGQQEEAVRGESRTANLTRPKAVVS